MKMQQPLSVKKYISWIFAAIVFVFGITSLIYSGFMSYYSAKAVLNEFTVSIQDYLDNLTANLLVERDFNRTIVASDPNFTLLSTDGTSDAARLPSIYNLRQIIYYRDSVYCVNMFSDSKKDEVYYFSTLFPSENILSYRNAYRQIANNATEDSAVFGQWFHQEVGD